MPLVTTTVRFDSLAYEVIRDEARDAHVSVAQFMREAALVRAVIRCTLREHPGRTLDYARVAEEVERLAQMRRDGLTR